MKVNATLKHKLAVSAGLVLLAGGSLFVLGGGKECSGYIAHEWGTFTSVQGADGALLDWRPLETSRLREYLLKGGFLWVDDFWGTRAWEQWSDAMRQVLPEYPIFDIPPDHAVLHSLYDIKEVEQVSNIRFWMQTGSVSERGFMNDSPHVNFRGIQDARGRLMVVMAHNTDIPDTWEREGESQEYFDRFSPNGYALGVNIMIYAMTH